MERTIKIAAVQLKNYVGERSRSFAASEQFIRRVAAPGFKADAENHSSNRCMERKKVLYQ